MATKYNIFNQMLNKCQCGRSQENQNTPAVTTVATNAIQSDITIVIDHTKTSSIAMNRDMITECAA